MTLTRPDSTQIAYSPDGPNRVSRDQGSKNSDSTSLHDFGFVEGLEANNIAGGDGAARRYSVNHGKATILQGTTEVIIDPKLTSNPDVVNITPANAQAVGKDMYVGVASSTQLQVLVSAAPIQDLVFFWEAKVDAKL